MLCLLSPLFAVLIRRAPLIGLLLVAVIFMRNFDGLLVIRTDMPVTFYFGGLCALHKVDLRRLDKYALPCFGLFVALCCAVVAYRVENTTGLRLIAPLLVWPAASLFVGIRFGAWAASMGECSFFIFLIHAPVLTATWVAYSAYGDALPYPVYWIIAPVFTTALLIGVYRLCKANIPTLFAWAPGVSSRRAMRSEKSVLTR